MNTGGLVFPGNAVVSPALHSGALPATDFRPVFAGETPAFPGSRATERSPVSRERTRIPFSHRLATGRPGLPEAWKHILEQGEHP